LNKQLADRIDAFMQPLVARGDANGVVLVAQGDEAVFAKTYGLASRTFGVPNALNTRFMVGSIGKQFTAAAVLVLQDQGRLSIQNTLARYVPDFPNGDRITLHQLLTHTAGLARDLPDLEHNTTLIHSLAEIAELIKTAPPAGEPGERTAYSNNGYRLLAYIVEQVSGQPFHRFVQQDVLERADMRESGVLRDQDLVPNLATGYCPWPGPDGLGPAPYASATNGFGPGGIYSTASDLVKWSRVFTTDAVLSPQARQQMLTPTDAGRGLGPLVYERYGRRCAGHDGVYRGYIASFETCLDEGTTLVYLGNIETGCLDLIRAGLPAMVFDQPYAIPQPSPTPVAVDTARLSSYAGDYQVFPGLTLHVRQMDDWLMLGAGDGFFLLDPIGPDRFFYRLKYATVTFERDALGRTSTLNWSENGATYPCKRVD
jgi:CubicO group peptidase (beta-lactamase class C family)